MLVKQALGEGLFLRDPHSPARTYSTADHRRLDPAFRPGALATLDRRLTAVRSRFGTNPKVLTRIAVRCVLQPDAAALVGFRDVDQITTSLGDPLRQDEIPDITALLHPLIDEGTPVRAVHRG